MIPSNWIPHRRASDEELVGYLVPQGPEVVPVTLFGCPMGKATDAASARSTLERVGLSCLAELWQLQLHEGRTISVRIREVSSERVVVIPDTFGVGGPLRDAVALDVPEGGRLFR